MEQDKREAAAIWISEIRDTMEENDFQRDFFESLVDQFEERSSLSDKQYECIRRIYDRVTG